MGHPYRPAPAPPTRRRMPFALLAAYAIIAAYLAAVVAAGCGLTLTQAAARTSSALAIGANNIVLPALKDAYQRGGESIASTAPDRATATAQLADYDAHWRPVWGVCDDAAAGPEHHCHDGYWPALVQAHGALADYLERESGGYAVTDEETARLARAERDAGCQLVRAIPAASNVAREAMAVLSALCPATGSDGGVEQ